VIENHVEQKLSGKNEWKIAAEMEKCGRQLRAENELAVCKNNNMKNDLSVL